MGALNDLLNKILPNNQAAAAGGGAASGGSNINNTNNEINIFENTEAQNSLYNTLFNADKDKDDNLNKDELMSYLDDLHENQDSLNETQKAFYEAYYGSEISDDALESINNAYQEILLLDTNQDGEISEDEFKEFDANGDGEISEDEFKEFDANGDGKISSAEYIYTVIKSNFPSEVLEEYNFNLDVLEGKTEEEIENILNDLLEQMENSNETGKQTIDPKTNKFSLWNYAQEASAAWNQSNPNVINTDTVTEDIAQGLADQYGISVYKDGDSANGYSDEFIALMQQIYEWNKEIFDKAGSFGGNRQFLEGQDISNLDPKAMLMVMLYMSCDGINNNNYLVLNSLITDNNNTETENTVAEPETTEEIEEPEISEEPETTEEIEEPEVSEETETPAADYKGIAFDAVNGDPDAHYGVTENNDGSIEIPGMGIKSSGEVTKTTISGEKVINGITYTNAIQYTFTDETGAECTVVQYGNNSYTEVTRKNPDGTTDTMTYDTKANTYTNKTTREINGEEVRTKYGKVTYTNEGTVKDSHCEDLTYDEDGNVVSGKSQIKYIYNNGNYHCEETVWDISTDSNGNSILNSKTNVAIFDENGTKLEDRLSEDKVDKGIMRPQTFIKHLYNEDGSVKETVTGTYNVEDKSWEYNVEGADYNYSYTVVNGKKTYFVSAGGTKMSFESKEQAELAAKAARLYQDAGFTNGNLSPSQKAILDNLGVDCTDFADLCEKIQNGEFDESKLEELGEQLTNDKKYIDTFINSVPEDKRKDVYNIMESYDIAVSEGLLIENNIQEMFNTLITNLSKNDFDYIGSAEFVFLQDSIKKLLEDNGITPNENEINDDDYDPISVYGHEGSTDAPNEREEIEHSEANGMITVGSDGNFSEESIAQICEEILNGNFPNLNYEELLTSGAQGFVQIFEKLESIDNKAQFFKMLLENITPTYTSEKLFNLASENTQVADILLSTLFKSNDDGLLLNVLQYAPNEFIGLNSKTGLCGGIFEGSPINTLLNNDNTENLQAARQILAQRAGYQSYNEWENYNIYINYASNGNSASLNLNNFQPRSLVTLFTQLGEIYNEHPEYECFNADIDQINYAINNIISCFDCNNPITSDDFCTAIEGMGIAVNRNAYEFRNKACMMFTQSDYYKNLSEEEKSEIQARLKEWINEN